MSIASEISRLQTARNTIRGKMVDFGLGASTDKFDDLADEIDDIANRGAVSQTLDSTTQSYTVPAGYHNGAGSVQITTEETSATPTQATQIIVPTSGKVLSKVTVNPIPSNYGLITWDGSSLTVS